MSKSDSYQRIRKEAQQVYSQAQPLWSPALQEMVHFNADGFNHLVFKAPRKKRDKQNQVARFRMLRRAINLVALSTTYQEYEEVRRRVKTKDRESNSCESQSVTYWGLIAIIDRRKIKVVLRRIGKNGKLHFWSVIPAWITSKRRDARFIDTPIDKIGKN